MENITDTHDPRFGSDANADASALHLDTEVPADPQLILGGKVYETYGKMHLLIKFNQAKGNSFQLHRKTNTTHPHWKPKPESWYYLEEGMVTFGIRPGCKVDEYKKVCLEINEAMEELSKKVVEGVLSLAEAKEQAKTMIAEKNPWQFVNSHKINKYGLIDLSPGGLHHSWEEDKGSDLGNVVYEVQEDVMDNFCTIRSFDQGKFKSDGTIRKLAIEDYFTFLDADPKANNVDSARRVQQDEKLLRTDRYALDILDLRSPASVMTGNSFAHLWVRDGEVDVAASDGSVRLGKGHSVFIPQYTTEYEIKPRGAHAVVLKTFVEV